jgi:hypothetical protein
MRTSSMILMVAGWAVAQSGLDTFGLERFHPSKVGYREWNSAHWANGHARSVAGGDPDDPTGWSADHSCGTPIFSVDGAGLLKMSGCPRFQIDPTDSTNQKTTKQKFRDIEFTGYFRRSGNSGKDYGGAVVGARSGALGHASPGGNDCDATTYYGRFRDDGKYDIEKELKHPGSTYWSGSGYDTQNPLWGGSCFPIGRWVGMKYLVWNIDNDTQVRFELWIDSISNGRPVGGGHWQKVFSLTDSGSWPSADVSGCAYSQNFVVTQGGGNVLLRTDDPDEVDWTMVSVREIDPTKTLSVHSGARGRPGGMRVGAQGMEFAVPVPDAWPWTVQDARGRIERRGTVSVGATSIGWKTLSSGLHLVQCRGPSPSSGIFVLP